MGKFIDMTNTTINGFTCLKELGKGKVWLMCCLCKREFEVYKSDWRNGAVACKNPECEKCKKKNMMGMKINDFVCNKELGNKRVLLKCLSCGETFEGDKSNWQKGKISCINEACQKHIKIGTTFVDMTGKEINGFRCVQELGYDRVLLECLSCGSQFERVKSAWKAKRVSCTNSACKKCRFANAEGRESSGFRCLRDLGNDRVWIKCLKCKMEFEAGKQNWKDGKVSCRNTNCSQYSVSDFIDMTGKEVNNFRCVKELGNNRVLIRCLNCNKEFVRAKFTWKNGTVICPNCGIKGNQFKSIEGHIINNVLVVKFAYMGRDNIPYYFCKRLGTKDVIDSPLSYSELFTYRKGNTNEKG